MPIRLPDELLHRITGGGFRMGPYRGDVRKSDRFPVRRRATLCRIDSRGTNGPPLQVLVRELSATGVGLVLPDAIAPNENFLLRLPASEGEVSIECQAVRCEQAPSAARIFLIGAAYRRVVSPVGFRESSNGRSGLGQARDGLVAAAAAQPALAGAQRRTLSGNFSAK